MERQDKIEVICQITHGNPVFPDYIPPRILAKDYPYNRMGTIVDMIRDKGDCNKIRLSNVTKESLKNCTDITRVYGDKNYYFYHDSLHNQEIIYRIEEVKPGMPWTIVHGDSGEHVVYLNDEDCVIIDESLMYAIPNYN